MPKENVRIRYQVESNIMEAKINAHLTKDTHIADLKRARALRILLYVTHDRREALSMADRAGVMHKGKLTQIGTPDEIYNHPADSFTARFLGDVNTLPCGGGIRPERVKTRLADDPAYHEYASKTPIILPLIPLYTLDFPKKEK